MNPPANQDPPPAYDFTDEDRHSMEDESRPLPKGWVRDYDHANKHHFYVDTTTKPPRSIWVHPIEDEQFQREHPELFRAPEGAPPSGSRTNVSAGPSSERNEQPEKKGFMQKMKEKAAEHAAKKEEERRRREQLQRASREALQRYVMRRQQLQQQGPAQQAYGQGSLYGPPNAYGYGRYPPPGMAYGGRRRGGGGMAMPLMGGLAGGMLLGSMLDGDGYGDGYGDGFGDGFDGGGMDF